MQYGTSGPSDRLSYRVRKLGHRGAVELGDVVLDHLGVQGCPREDALTAHFEKCADVLAVGQAEREQVRDDEDLDVHQHHETAGVGAFHHRLLVPADVGSASLFRLFRSDGFTGGDACTNTHATCRTAPHTFSFIMRCVLQAESWYGISNLQILFTLRQTHHNVHWGLSGDEEKC